MMKSELPLIINNFEEELILDSTHVHLGLDLTYVKVKTELSAAFNKWKQNKERESFLWHRLAFFPTSFDGRIIVSKLLRDINESQEDDKKGNSSPESAQSLLWGLGKKHMKNTGLGQVSVFHTRRLRFKAGAGTNMISLTD